MSDQEIAKYPIGADTDEEISKFISHDIISMYDVYSYRHAASILKNSFPTELIEIENALRNFKITTFDIGAPGGNESVIPKKISHFLRPKEWYEARIQGDLLIRIFEYTEEFQSDGSCKKHSLPKRELLKIENYIDGHKIDYVKDKVAFDMEWNSKDQTYDRDLYAFRMFHECGIISAAIMLTRSEKLNPLFMTIPRRKKDGSIEKDINGQNIPCNKKYGASTTWMGKLLYRLNAGRHGGCPVLVFGITPSIVNDWPIEGNVE